MKGKNQAGNVNGKAAMVSLSRWWGIMVGLSGCFTNANAALTIEQAQVPEGDDKGCTIPAGESELYQPSGRLDVGLDRDYPYKLYPLVKNNLTMTAMAGKEEANLVVFEGFRVKLVPPPGLVVDFSGCPAEFDYPNPKTLQPASSLVGEVYAIMPCHVSRIRAALTQKGARPNDEALFTSIVRAQGRHGGNDILSDDFSFPIRVCLGCLQRGFTTPGFERFDYPNTPKCSDLVANPFVGNPCNIAQDFGPVLCCQRDATGVIECPGRPTPVAP